PSYPPPNTAPPVPPVPPTNTAPPVPSIGTTARLIARLANAPVPEFSINGGAVVGIFTPESGPVDIDLEAFPGNETISKQHAEIFYENGAWILKDSSTNGTYIKPVGQTRFGARVMGPTAINSGDEIAFARVVFVFQTP
ncbi:FHA domain-containing protein, partial [Crocosphaera watsonii]|uniref:FHA domain-containing protein n=1 Tax=Crocosphaera watsonii TaxID=263511 RepID=UPI000569149C